jgi:hypothetical protein
MNSQRYQHAYMLWFAAQILRKFPDECRCYARYPAITPQVLFDYVEMLNMGNEL